MKASNIIFVSFIGLFDITKTEGVSLSVESDKKLLTNLSKHEESTQPGLRYAFGEDILPNATNIKDYVVPTLDYRLDLRYPKRTICEEVEKAVKSGVYQGGENRQVAARIYKKLLRSIGRRGKYFFVIVYDPVYGASKHWGHSHCGTFYRIPSRDARDCRWSQSCWPGGCSPCWYNVRVLLGLHPRSKSEPNRGCTNANAPCIIRIRERSLKNPHWALRTNGMQWNYLIDPGICTWRGWDLECPYIFAVS